MLRKEIDRNYIVYPSWADLAANWDDLPRLLADPLRSGFLQPNFDPSQFGYPERIQPYEIISGPEGGGLIMWCGVPTRGRWLPLCVLTSEANLRTPPGSDSLYGPSDPYVAYLEPMGAPGWQLGLAKKPSNVRPGISPEHADSAEGKICWLVRFKRAREPSQEIKGLSSVPSWAQHFGLDAKRLSGPSDALRAETDPWFPNQQYQSVWFEISGDGDRVGYHFAVIVYIGNHLRWIAGPRMDSMHLIAQIEGRPSLRRHWSRKN